MSGLSDRSDRRRGLCPQGPPTGPPPPPCPAPAAAVGPEPRHCPGDSDGDLNWWILEYLGTEERGQIQIQLRDLPV